MRKHILFQFTFTFFIFFSACSFQREKSNVILKSNFKFVDSSFPILKSGIYMITDSDTGILKRLYSLSNSNKNITSNEYKLETQDFVSFENLESIYITKSKSEYEGFYDITLKFNPLGRIQFYNLTKKCKDLTEAEKYDGLLIGAVVRNTLVQISHVQNPIDTNLISLAGSEFNKATAEDIVQYLKDGIAIKEKGSH